MSGNFYAMSVDLPPERKKLIAASVEKIVKLVHDDGLTVPEGYLAIDLARRYMQGTYGIKEAIMVDEIPKEKEGPN